MNPADYPLALQALYGPDCVALVEAGTRDFLRSQFEVIDESFRDNAPGFRAPKLLSVHSHVKKPQLLEGSTVDHLIFDQSLQKLFNCMNQFCAQGSQFNASFELISFCLVGQRLYLAGKFVEADYLVPILLGLRELREANDVFRAWDGLSVAVQSIFVLAHEMVHVAFRQGIRSQLTDTKFYQQYLRRVEDALDRPELTERELRDSVEAKMDSIDFSGVDEDLREDIKKSERIRVQMDLTNRHNHSDRLLSNPRLQEEAVCDLIASHVTLELVSDKVMPKHDVIRLCNFAIQHMRILDMVDDFVLQRHPDPYPDWDIRVGALNLCSKLLSDGGQLKYDPHYDAVRAAVDRSSANLWRIAKFLNGLISPKVFLMAAEREPGGRTMGRQALNTFYTMIPV